MTSVDPTYDAVDPDDVDVKLLDNDLAHVRLSVEDLEVWEGGGATFEVVLVSEPASDAVVVAFDATPSAFSVVPSSLSFDASNWATPQTVSVFLRDDAIYSPSMAGDLSAEIVAPRYGGWGLHTPFGPLRYGRVRLLGRDNDGPPAIVLAPTPLVVNEGRRTTHSFEVALGAEPTSDVSLDLASSDPSQIGVSPAALVFSPGSWSEPQSVTVYAIDDGVPDGSVSSSIVTSALASADPLFDGFDPPDVQVVVTDDETPGVTVRPLGPPEIGEPGALEVEVFLNTPPAQDVWLTMWSTIPDEARATPLLRFTPLGDPVATFRASAVDDTLDTGALSLTIITDPLMTTDPAYSRVDPADVNVVCLDAE